MKKNITNYIEQFKQTLNFSDLSWWIIDYKNDPGYFYCNEVMANTFNLDINAQKHSVVDTCPIAGDYIKNVNLASTDKANLIIREYLELLNQEKKEYNNTFPYYDIHTDTIKYFSSKAKALELDEEGNVSILFGLIENITSKETLSKELKEYHNIIDTNVMTATTNTKGIILNCSSALCNITGYSKEELVGQKYNILKHPDTSEKVFEKMELALAKGEIWENEIKNQKKNGEEYWIKLIVSPIFNEQGKIKAFTTINQDITDKKIIEKLSKKDKLTNLYNRAKLDILLEKELQTFERYETNSSIIMLDIDYFKSINDNYGHLIGDKVLVQIASILRSNTRITDFVGRWGGEEFLIICPNSDIENTEKVATKLKDVLEFSDFGMKKNVTASFGISSYKENDTVDTLLQRADNALYNAKENGRNTVELIP